MLNFLSVESISSLFKAGAGFKGLFGRSSRRDEDNNNTGGLKDGAEPFGSFVTDGDEPRPNRVSDSHRLRRRRKGGKPLQTLTSFPMKSQSSFPNGNRRNKKRKVPSELTSMAQIQVAQERVKRQLDTSLLPLPPRRSKQLALSRISTKSAVEEEKQHIIDLNGDYEREVEDDEEGEMVEGDNESESEEEAKWAGDQSLSTRNRARKKTKTSSSMGIEIPPFRLITTSQLRSIRAREAERFGPTGDDDEVEEDMSDSCFLARHREFEEQEVEDRLEKRYVVLCMCVSWREKERKGGGGGNESEGRERKGRRGGCVELCPFSSDTFLCDSSTRMDEPERWRECDNPKCKKWRLVDSNSKKVMKRRKFFCGNLSYPSVHVSILSYVLFVSCVCRLWVCSTEYPYIPLTPSFRPFIFHFLSFSHSQHCAKLDDWIVRCVGEEAAEKLTGKGVSTVEGIENKPKRLNLLQSLGYYYDVESQTIHPYSAL